MEQIEFFIRLRDGCDAIIKAHDDKDMEEFENAIGRFLLLMIQLETLK